MADNEIRSQEWVDKIEELVRQAEVIPDMKARSVIIDLLKAVLDFHAAGLERMMDIVFDSGLAGEAIADQVLGDDLTSSMLLLHNLHPDDVETRVARAVQKLEEMFFSLGVKKLSLVGIEGGVVRLHFESQRTWSGTPVKASIEKAIFQAAPEITSVVVEGLKEALPPGFVPVSDLLAGVRL
ncbi:MAG TPA: hypothetical protein VH302_05260 [Bryobacteraceae bacterium]|jgi:hypothetical protein|nr:hypothetical protein [Bryobacteraceae bacterium]